MHFITLLEIIITVQFIQLSDGWKQLLLALTRTYLKSCQYLVSKFLHSYILVLQTRNSFILFLKQNYYVPVAHLLFLGMVVIWLLIWAFYFRPKYPKMRAEWEKKLQKRNERAKTLENVSVDDVPDPGKTFFESEQFL